MGGQSSNTKGDRAERELIDVLGTLGFAAMRAPASGSATVRSLPDILAGCPVTDEDSFIGERFALVYGIECKYSTGDPIYIDAEEIQKLTAFCNNFGARARIAARFATRRGDPAWGEDASGFYVFEADDLHLTDSGKNYRIKKETALKEGTPVEAL